MKTKWLSLLFFLSFFFMDPALGQDAFTNSIGMEFVYIKPGTFIMGSPIREIQRVIKNYPNEKNLDEKQHEVTLTEGYYIQTTEVTQGQWKEITNTNPSSFVNCGDNCPVDSVSWEDVQIFIQKLNAHEGTSPSHNEYMLPTEAQWENACRAGSNASFTSGRMIGLDNNLSLDTVAWYSGNSRKKVHPVATKKPNKWGLYDMHGNVVEWCRNSKYRYPEYPLKNPPISYLDSGSNHVYRGGSWGDPPYVCRSAYRKAVGKNYQNMNLGFRLIKRHSPR
jgi:formylglycine-generating enzyme required for sulfatase activity